MCNDKKYISNADEPRDAASCKIDHIALHVECYLQTASVANDIKSTLLNRPSPIGYQYIYVHAEAQTPIDRFVVDIIIQARLQQIQ